MEVKHRKECHKCSYYVNNLKPLHNIMGVEAGTIQRRINDECL